MGRRVTIKDVAREAGVSVTTVSQALNDPVGSRVAASTRDHVQAVAQRLGYRASPAARALRTSRTDTIALIGHDLVTTEFLGRMLRGAQDEVRGRGGLLIVADTGEDEDAVVRTLIDHQVDGVILGAFYHQELRVPASLAGMPTVLVNAFTADPAYSSVVPDEVAGGRLATEVLLAAGHRRVAMLGNHDDIPATPGRRVGFLARCREAGDSVSARVVECAPRARAAREATRALLTGPDGQVLTVGQGRPTGLFAFSDVMVLGVYAAAADLGLRVPTDLSVVGFDDMSLIDDSLAPPVTSVALPHGEMAAWAVQQLYALLDAPADERPEPSRQALVGRVVERESVAPPPGSGPAAAHRPWSGQGAR